MGVTFAIERIGLRVIADIVAKQTAKHILVRFCPLLENRL